MLLYLGRVSLKEWLTLWLIIGACQKRECKRAAAWATGLFQSSGGWRYLSALPRKLPALTISSHSLLVFSTSKLVGGTICLPHQKLSPVFFLSSLPSSCLKVTSDRAPTIVLNELVSYPTGVPYLKPIYLSPQLKYCPFSGLCALPLLHLITLHFNNPQILSSFLSIISGLGFTYSMGGQADALSAERQT